MKLKAILNKFAGKPVNVADGGAAVVGVTNLLMKKARISRADLRKLLEDDEIYSAISTRLAAIHACTWDATGLTQEQEDNLKQHLPVLIDSIFDSILFGYSVTQVVPDGDRIAQVIPEEFESFEFQAGGGEIKLLAEIKGRKVDVLRAFPTKSNQTFFNLSVYKPSRSHPDGKPLLSLLYWPWMFRQQGWEYWGRFVERFGQPWTWAKTAGDAQKIADQLYSAVQDAVIVSDPATELTLITPKGDGDAHQAFIENVDKRIQKTVLGQTLTTDVGKNGSYAAAKVHNLVRRDRLYSDIAYIVPEINKVIRRIYGESATVVANIPQSGDIERDEKLFAMGVRFSKQYYSKRYGIDVDEFDVVDVDGGQVGSQVGSQAGDQAGLAAKGADTIKAGADAWIFEPASRFTPVQAAIERDIEQLMQTIYRYQLEKISAAIQAAEKPEDLMALLSVPDMREMHALADAAEVEMIRGAIANKKREY